MKTKVTDILATGISSIKALFGDATWKEVALPIDVSQEGSPVVTDVVNLNFTGAGVTVTDDGSGIASIDIPGGGGGGSGTNFVRIGTPVVTSGNQTLVSFATIPGTYDELWINIVGRINLGGTDAEDVFFRFNGDSGNHYGHGKSGFFGSSAFGSTGATEPQGVLGTLAAVTSQAGEPGNMFVRIPRYADSTWKKVAQSHGMSVGSGPPINLITSFYWDDTSPITDIDIFPPSGNYFIDGTRVELIGVTYDGESAGGSVPIEQEGSTVVASPTAINFTGAGVAVTDVSGVATVDIPGGGGGGGGGGFPMLYDLSKGVPLLSSALTPVGNATYFSWDENPGIGLNVKQFANGGGVTRLAGFTNPIPGSTFHVAVLALPTTERQNYYGISIAAYNSANDHYHQLNISGANGFNGMELSTWAGVDNRVGNASNTTGPFLIHAPLWLHIKSDGTDLSFGWSVDGANPVFPYTGVAISSYLSDVTDVFFGMFIYNSEYLQDANVTFLCYDDDADARVMGTPAGSGGGSVMIKDELGWSYSDGSSYGDPFAILGHFSEATADFHILGIQPDAGWTTGGVWYGVCYEVNPANGNFIGLLAETGPFTPAYNVDVAHDFMFSSPVAITAGMGFFVGIRLSNLTGTTASRPRFKNAASMWESAPATLKGLEGWSQTVTPTSGDAPTQYRADPTQPVYRVSVYHDYIP